MTYYNKKKLLSYMEEQLEEYYNPETDPRIPLLDKIDKLKNMDPNELRDILELRDLFIDDDVIGDEVKDIVIKELKAANAPQSELERVEEMNPFEVMDVFGLDKAETIQEIAINNVNKQLDTIEKNIEDLQEDIEEIRNTPSKYFD